MNVLSCDVKPHFHNLCNLKLYIDLVEFIVIYNIVVQTSKSTFAIFVFFMKDVKFDYNYILTPCFVQFVFSPRLTMCWSAWGITANGTLLTGWIIWVTIFYPFHYLCIRQLTPVIIWNEAARRPCSYSPLRLSLTSDHCWWATFDISLLYTSTLVNLFFYI